MPKTSKKLQKRLFSIQKVIDVETPCNASINNNDLFLYFVLFRWISVETKQFEL